MKQAQVIWSDEALKDLESIYEFLEQKSQPAAQQLIENILGRSRQLETFPESGASQVSALKNYRYLVESHYKIMYSYQIENHTVFILTIFDTRRNPDELKV